MVEEMKYTVLFSIWLILTVVVSALSIFEVAAAPAIGSFCFTYMQGVGQLSLIDVLTRPEVFGIILAMVSLLGGGTAWFMRRRRRVRARTLLDEVDEVYSRFKMNSRRCEAELYRLRDIALENVKTGKIDESHYDIVKERIDEYVHEIRERIVDERLGGFPSKLREELRDMIKKGEISEKEYKTLGRLIERTGELKETDKEQLRELLEQWKKDYIKKETPERPIERKSKLKEPPENAIFTATDTGDVEQVKALLKRDPGLVNARHSGTGFTPLHFAASLCLAEVVRVLLAHGANVNAQNEKGVTPLHLARGDAEVVELLLAEGAEVTARTSNGYTALQLAEQEGHVEVAKLLRRHEEAR